MNKQIEEMAKTIHQAEMEDMMLKVTGDIDYLIDAMPMNVYVAQELYNAGYRKASDVIDEVLEILSELKEDFRYYDDAQKVSAIRYAETNIAAFKKKFESEGADDE